jgi:hypothetical protein
MAMTARRYVRPERHTKVANSFIRRPYRSGHTFHVACYLMSNTVDFEITHQSVGKVLHINPDTVGNCLRELEKLGFLIRNEVRNKLGHRVGTQLLISDIEFSTEEREALTQKIQVRPSDLGGEAQRGPSPTGENPEHKKTSSSKKINDLPEDQTDQQILLDESSDGQASLLPDLEPEPKGSPEPKPDPLVGFAAFYALYPRHVGRKGAERSWLAAIRRGANPELIMEGCRRYAGERAGQDKTYTKHPSTWLNQDCWLDEPASRPVANGGTTLNISNQDYWDGVAAEEAEAAANAEPTPTYF